jgi:hypothetical protein
MAAVASQTWASPDADELSLETVALPADAADKPDSLKVRTDVIHELLESWLKEPGASLACGRWGDGAISEIMLNGTARLLPGRYSGPFSGIRELQLADAPHHLHVDLARVERISIAVAPSVCLGFRPSFEVRLLTKTKPREWLVSLFLCPPYNGDKLDVLAARQFLQRACDQVRAHPEVAELTLDINLSASPDGQALLSIVDALDPNGLLHEPEKPARSEVLEHRPEPAYLPLLRQALELSDASLVIYRDRTLVEFKTDHLNGVHRYEEEGHVSWQLGDFEHHHCHLALDAVTRVLFSAEPVSCQGNGLNYTVWFLTDGPSGNPYRRDGYFSVTLNRPYLENAPGAAPRSDVIQPVLDLYRQYRGAAWLEVDEMFLTVLVDGPPPRPAVQPSQS